MRNNLIPATSDETAAIAQTNPRHRATCPNCEVSWQIYLLKDHSHGLNAPPRVFLVCDQCGEECEI